MASNISSALAGLPAEVRARLERGVTRGFIVGFVVLAALAVIRLTIAAIALGPGWGGPLEAVS